MTKRNKSDIQDTTNDTVELPTITEVLQGLPTKSARIRFLDSQGYTRSQIATVLGIRYQHVRNVLITPLVTPK